MKRNLIIAGTISAIVAFTIGYKIGAFSELSTSKVEMDHHNHEQLEVVNNSSIPSISTEIIKDPKSGWNLHIETDNFRFSPENASTEHIEGEGHAHLYINEQKITRIYSNWYYIEKLAPGKNEIKVTLNSNDHKELAINGSTIESINIINNEN